MRWLITGAHGQLGSDLQRVLAPTAGSTDQVAALGSKDLDITDRAAIAAAVAETAPEVIVNAAAYTAVDAAETDEERAYAINATGPALLAAEAARSGAKLIQVSTDYVFDGRASVPYPVDAPTNPQSAYGRTKLAGELAVRELAPQLGYLVRTAWVYGASGANFVKTMARLEKGNLTLSVVDDQRGSPTWSQDLARGIVELVRSGAPAGTYHCTNGGDTTWYGFTQAIFAELAADPDRVLPTTTDKFPRPAPRPAYSVLADDGWRAAGLSPLPGWREALRAAFVQDREAYLPASPE
ncbi:MAG: dTDP-4-dehydrorhamnose reductase [Actinomycetota bacterium]|nr:dTDP-4-dehydrorhamnose reductase [Actinomycetota bacterium]